MKAYLKPLFAAALAVTLSSCDKNAERIETLSEKSARSTSEVVYPLLDKEMSASILPKKDNLPDGTLTKDDENFPNIKVKLIDLVCDEYIQQTTKLDISKLQEGQYLEQIQNDNLTVLFRSSIDLKGEGFRMLANGPVGWWTHWNYSSYTESEYPRVLFAEDKYGQALDEFNIILDREVTTFGFEVAPNALGEDLEMSAGYNLEDHYRSPYIFYVTQTISSPSGARLIAVKSDKPFQRLNIHLNSRSAGIAISNIRYKLAR